MSIIQGDWHRLAVNPVAGDGLTGDFCIQTTSGHFWTKESGTWVDLGPTGSSTGHSIEDDYNGLNANNLLLNQTLGLPPGGKGWRLTITLGDRDVYGMTAATAGKVLLLFNADASSKVKIKDDSNNTTAVNRFRCPDGADFEIEENGSVYVRYDGTFNRWHILGVKK